MKRWNKSLDNSPTNQNKGEASLTSDNKVVYFRDFSDGTTPFDIHPDDDENEDVFSYSFVSSQCYLINSYHTIILLNLCKRFSPIITAF